VTGLLTDGKSFRGKLLELDDARLTLQIGPDRKVIPLRQVKPANVYAIRRRLIDPRSAADRMALGRFCLASHLPTFARREFSAAVELDPSLKAEVESLLAEAVAALHPNCEPATDEQAAANRRRSDAMAAKARPYSGDLRAVETKCFVLYTAHPKGADTGFATLCEKAYAALAEQFGVPASRNIWAGRLAVFLFAESEQYTRFARENGQRAMETAGAYYHHDGEGFVYIAMNRSWFGKTFEELLVHEMTHAFACRYLTNRSLPKWVDEGLAEYMAAELVPGWLASRRDEAAAKQVAEHGADASHVFTDLKMDAFDYGVAQGLVRWLIAKDRKAFVRFVGKLKEGKPSEKALRETFGLTHESLLRLWRQAAQDAADR